MQTFTKNMILMGIGYAIAFFLLFWSFQNPTIYQATLGKISSTYKRNYADSIQVKKIKAPFSAISNENLVHWDAEYYDNIRQYQYFSRPAKKDAYAEKIFRDCSFAFFPLFAWVWKISQLPAKGIICLNFSLFLISLIALCHLFITDEKRKSYFFAFALLMPSTVIFLLPYSEATFFSMVTLAIFGMKKEKYALTFLGLMLAAMTRPAVTLVGAAIIGAEVLLFFKHQDFALFAKALAKKFAPLLLGTFFILAFQKYCGSGSWFKFMEVQKNWGTKLAFPNGITDWSWEGFGLDIVWLFLAFPLIVYGLLRYFFSLKIKKENLATLHSEASLLLISAGYLALVSFFAVFLHGGCINSLFRYAFCSPFFFILVAYLFERSPQISFSKMYIPFLIFLIISSLFLGMNHYVRSWNFERSGYILFVLLSFFLFYVEKMKISYKRIFLGFLVLLSLIWNTYLFNMYVCDGWIFT